MSNSSNNGKENREEELVFELSEIQTYDVTFVEKSKGKSKVGEIRAKGRAKGKERIKGRGEGLAKLKGEYKFSPRTIIVEMDDEDIKELAKDPNVIKIEPDILLKPNAVYNAPFHKNTDWMLEQVGAKTAFANGISGQGVKVAVLDSGVDTDNPMLVHAIKGGASVVYWSNDYEDKTGHGTNVAGILASKHQGKAYGVAPDVDLYAVKVTVSATSGSAHVSDVAMGVEWAINNGMQAINISFDAGGTTDSLDTAIARAHSLGIPIFNGAGNEKQDIDATKAESTRCKTDGVYCVLALNKENGLADFSAFGDEAISFSTYGDVVPVVWINRPEPTVASGTSFSSPLAMGIFALYKCKYPHLNGHEIIEIMKTNGNNFSIYNYLPVANSPVYVNDVVVNTPPTPSIPTFTLLSVTGNTAILRATVPSTSTPFDKLIIKNSWSSDKVITLKNKTRHYDFTIQAPSFKTQYQLSLKVVNGNLESSLSNTLTFTTTNETTYEMPLRPTLKYVDNDGLNVTLKVGVPAGSPTFNILEIEPSWVGGRKILNLQHTRTHEFTVTLPSYNTRHDISISAYNGDTFGKRSNIVNVKLADENSTEMPLEVKLSVVSISGKTVKLRAQVPKYSPMINRLGVWHRRNGGYVDDGIITFPKTRVHEFIVETPEYNTDYHTFVFPYNGNVGGYGSNNVEYTSGSANGNQPTPIAPQNPTLTLLSVNGKTATIRATVPNTSVEFNKLDLDYRWIAGHPDQTLTMANTRSYDFTVTAPDYNTSYSIDAKVYNGTLGSGWSNVLAFTTGNDISAVAPSNPSLSLVSVNGKTVTVRATVPATSTTFNKLQFDYYWISGTSDKVVTMANTRSYDLTFEAPDYDTEYSLDFKAFNGELASSWSRALTFTTGSDTSVIAPQNPTLSLVSVNGKTVTVRATVPSTSVEFDRIEVDYRWIAGYPDAVINTNKTRSYDITFEAPAFNTQYQMDVKVYNGTAGSAWWSNALTFTTDNAINNTVIEDFSDNIFNFNFTGDWYRDTTLNAFRSKAIGHTESSVTTFNIDGGNNGGELSLDYKTSSEQNWDKLNIYVNNVLKVTESGINNFKNFSTVIPAGNSVVKLEYIKDLSVSVGEDAGYVDNIKVTKR